MRSAEKIDDELYAAMYRSRRLEIIADAQREAVAETEGRVTKEHAAAACPHCADDGQSIGAAVPAFGDGYVHPRKETGRDGVFCHASPILALHASRAGARAAKGGV